MGNFNECDIGFFLLFESTMTKRSRMYLSHQAAFLTVKERKKQKRDVKGRRASVAPPKVLRSSIRRARQPMRLSYDTDGNENIIEPRSCVITLGEDTFAFVFDLSILFLHASQYFFVV